MARKNWTKEELIVAFNLYCKIPFSKINHNHKLVIELSNVINRTPSAVAWKLVNFASLDPVLRNKNIKGASNASKLDKMIFDDFHENWNELVYKSELAFAQLLKKSIINTENTDIGYLKIKEGKIKERIVKTRVNQSFFRNAILAAYEDKCCITGISIPDLLIASHIVPWAIDEKNRVNPKNGLCLNVMHDKAFDKGFITIDLDYRVKVSQRLKSLKQDKNIQLFLLNFEHKQIDLPKRFLPNVEFLKYHHQNIFKQ